MKRLLALAFLLPSLAFAASFPRDLSLGSRGDDVLALQQFLNRDAATQIAVSGVGSPGNETSYFGPATKRAVVRFQEKYRQEILAPNSLSSGTGRVGPSTRAVLESLSGGVSKAETATDTPASSTVPPPAPVPAAPVASSATNPNLKNLHFFLDALGTVAAKQGYTPFAIATLKQNTIQEVLATTTDMQAEFLSLLESRSPNKSLIGKLIASIEDMVGVRHAKAATGLPFGGALLFSFYCPCSGNWLLTIEPLPPTFVALLSYYSGSQAFLSYNIPVTRFLLGEYEPGAGVCLVPIGFGCAGKPTEGLITPMVGSSPI